MNNITLLFTKHKEYGNCNSNELLKIIESISPEIIFEELSYSNFRKSYQEGTLFTLETNAIKKYLQNHCIEHIPVDTYDLPKAYYEDLDYMYGKIFNNNTISESFYLRDLIDKQSALESQYGFGFLNSARNDEMFEKINVLKEKILDILNDKRLFNIDKLEKEVIAKREDEMLTNIYNYSRDCQYNQALVFIGSGHRELFIKNIEKYKMREKLKLNWIFFNDGIYKNI